MSLDFHLDRANSVALYQQISEYLKERICFGTLTPDAINAGVDVISRAIRERASAIAEPSVHRDNWAPLV